MLNFLNCISLNYYCFVIPNPLCIFRISSFILTGKTMQFDDICFYCGDTEVVDDADVNKLKEAFGIVRPICVGCKAMKPVKTRLALKTKKQRKS